MCKQLEKKGKSIHVDKTSQTQKHFSFHVNFLETELMASLGKLLIIQTQMLYSVDTYSVQSHWVSLLETMLAS